MKYDVKPYWFFVAGLVLLYVFAVATRRSTHLLGPGGTRYLAPIEGFDTGAKFFMFGVDWCPHCVKAKPLFESLGSTVTIGDQAVALQYVNPENDKAAAEGFQIDGYPTFYLVKGSQKIKYQGPRSAEGFHAFLSQQLGA
jgi:thiol-disulfide isomerase/thioredoxin